MMTVMRVAFLFAVMILLFGCGSSEKSAEKPPDTTVSVEPAPATVKAPVSEQPVDDRPVILAFGDSLSAGYGVDIGLSYPDFLQKLITQNGYRYRVVNQGISGDTSSGGRARIQQALGIKPEIVAIELGGNDGLRGVDPQLTRANMDFILGKFKEAGVKIVLSGMTLPPNFGPDYVKEFELIYADMRDKYKPAYLPFLLDGVYQKSKLMQQDGIHPTAEGNKIVAENIFRAMKPLLKK
jgi:acyl-CoA thioesterase I